MVGTNLGIKIFADTADVAAIRKYAGDARVAGFTTNPTLFRAAGASDYLTHARAVLDAAGDRPVSLEVVADEPTEMRRQALVLAALGPHVYVKVPVTTTDGSPTYGLVRELLQNGVRVNVTAVFTAEQVVSLGRVMWGCTATTSIISVFAGRIADTGRNAEQLVRSYRSALRVAAPATEVLWASPRQVYDVVQARRAGCDTITMSPALIEKTPLIGKNLAAFSQETVQMFYNDAQAAGYSL